MDIEQLMTPSAYMVCVVLFILGMVLKQTPSMKNWMIPYLLGISGIAFCNFLTEPGINATIQGILAAGFTVYTHQLSKQGMEFYNKKQNINKTNSF